MESDSAVAGEVVAVELECWLQKCCSSNLHNLPLKKSREKRDRLRRIGPNEAANTPTLHAHNTPMQITLYGNKMLLEQLGRHLPSYSLHSILLNLCC
jgi:hypothetical protein